MSVAAPRALSYINAYWQAKDFNVGKILLMMYVFLQGLQFNTYLKVQGVFVVPMLLINLL